MEVWDVIVFNELVSSARLPASLSWNQLESQPIRATESRHYQETAYMQSYNDTVYYMVLKFTHSTPSFLYLCYQIYGNSN